MNTLFKNNNGKKSKYDTNIHEAIIISDSIFQTNKTFFVTVHPKKTHVNWSLLVVY